MAGSPLTAIVVGGGIGGLTAALSLLRAGVHVQVFEQAPALTEIGAGVQLSPNCSRVLHHLGLGSALTRIAVRPDALESRRWEDGRLLGRYPVEPIMTAVGPAPTVYDQLGLIESRHGNRSENNAPRNVYQTADGSWVAVSSSAQSVAEWVMRLVGHPEVIGEPWFRSGRGRAEHADLLDGYVADWIRARPRAAVLEEFALAGAAVAAVYNAEDIVADPHIRETGMVTAVQDADLGSMLMHNVMWRMSLTPGQIRFTGRPLGADTEAVLTGELGYDAGQVAELRARGILR